MPMRKTVIFLALIFCFYSLVHCQPQQSVNVTVYPDGSIEATHHFIVNNETLMLHVVLLGQPMYLLVVDEQGDPVPFNLTGQVLTIELLGEKELYISYVVENAVIEQEGVYKLSLPPINGTYIIHLPNQSALLSFEPLPDLIEAEDGGLKIEFSNITGNVYIEFAVLPKGEGQKSKDYMPLIFAAFISVVAALMTWRFIVRRKSEKAELTETEEEIVRFLKSRGGEAYQSEIREYLELPTTTVWRKIKKLEELGYVSIKKTRRGSLVRLKKR